MPLDKDKKRIRYIKTLQHLSRKWDANIHFYYHKGQWQGDFGTEIQGMVTETFPNFTDMVKQLHMKVRTEL
jgi:hypothetical protein